MRVIMSLLETGIKSSSFNLIPVIRLASSRLTIFPPNESIRNSFGLDF